MGFLTFSGGIEMRYWTRIVNIFVSNLFLVVKDVNTVSYTDDSTFYDQCNIVKRSYYHNKVHPKNFFNSYQIIR